MFKSMLFPIAGICLFIVVVGFLTRGKIPFFENEKIIATNSKSIFIENKEIKIEIAKTKDERLKGLSNRNFLDENSGMLFVFEKKERPVFWMKDTKIPLDIIWISDKKIVGIEKDVQPQINVPDSMLKKYPAPQNIDFVLEVNGGFSDKNNIKIGQTISGLEQF